MPPSTSAVHIQAPADIADTVTRPIQSRIALLWGLLLSAAGLAGNLVAVPLSTGVHLLPGGIAVMLAVRCLGLLPTTVVAVVVSAWTLVLWQHPYAIPIFVAEAVAVWVLHRRCRLDMLAADALFWLLAGAPAALLLYRFGVLVNGTGAELIALKQAANGLVNVILANLLWLFGARVLRRAGQVPPALSLSTLLFNLLAGFVLIPGLLLVRIDAGQVRDDLLDASAHQLDAAVARIRQRSLYVTAGLRRELAADLRQALTERSGRTAGAVSAEAVMAALAARRRGQPMRLQAPGGAVVLSPAAAGPDAAITALREAMSAGGGAELMLDQHANLLVVVRAESPDGVWRLAAALPLEAPLLLVEGFGTETPDLLVALMDADGECHVGVSGPDCFRLAEMLSDPAHERVALRGAIEALTPTGAGLSAMGRAERTLYLVRLPLSQRATWDLVVARAARADVGRARAHFARALATLLLVLLCALPAAYLFGRWLSGLLGRLSRTMAILTDGAEGRAKPRWPCAGVSEIDALTDQMRTMTEALCKALEDGRASAEEQRVLAERLQVANRGAGIGVWEWHLASGELIFDEQMYEVLGVDRALTPSYQLWLNQLVPEDRRSTEIELCRCLAGEDTFRTEFRICHPRHGLRFVLGYAVIFRDAAGRAVRLVGLNWDVTEQRLLHAGLIQSSKLATLGEMATAVAHELNQPLNVIGMAAGNLGRRLKSGSLDPGYLDDKVAVIRAQVQRAAAIIDHMRIFGRRAEGAPGPLDVGAAVRAAAELLGEQLRQARVALTVDCVEDLPPVLGHQVQVEQVVLNLLTNARDAFSDCARVEAWIRVRVSAADGFVEMRVEDNAGGIAPGSLDRVFEPFFTTKAPGKGTGLGLSVSYGIVTDMHGTISVENTAAGAAFLVRLPALAQGGGP